MEQRIRVLLITLGVVLCGVAASVQGLPAEDIQAEARYDKSWALIIGIEQYTLAPPVPGAVDEAKLVAQAFRQLGFDEIIELYNKEATSRRLRHVFTDILTRKASQNGRVVVFFSGHTGLMRDSKGKEGGYLVPADAQVNNVAKSLTVETLKEYTRRSSSKHTLLIIDGSIGGWEPMAPQPGSPEANAQDRTVQVIAVAGNGEKSVQARGRTVFAQALVTGLSGAADADQNGRLTASELGAYMNRQVEISSQGAQHVTTLRLNGNGDTVLLRQQTISPVLRTSRETQEGREAAERQYEQAVALLQGGKYAEEALARLDRAIESDPTFGEAYILKSYLHLEMLPRLDEALAAGQQAVKHAPDNAESFYTLGLVQEKLGQYREAEEALVQASKLKPDNLDVFYALGMLYTDRLMDDAKSAEAFRRYLELGGADPRARAIVSQSGQSASDSPADSSP